MNPLFNDIQMRLFHLNHSPYSWYWNVRFIPLEAVYIGNDTCHILAEEQLCHYGEVRNQNGSEQQQKQMKDAFVKLIHFYCFI